MAKKKTLALFFISFFFWLPFSEAHAESLTLGPIVIQIPPGWQCQPQDQNFICLDKSATSKKNSAIVVSFKKRTAEDSLVVYRDQLSRPRTLHDGDVAIPSQPLGVHDISLNGATWIEGIHNGSEIPQYYTHYYATVASQYAILVSLSIEKSAYHESLPLLKPIIDSMKLNINQEQNDIANGPSTYANPEALGTAKTSVEIMGHQIPRLYIYIAVGLIAGLALLGYALLSD